MLEVQVPFFEYVVFVEQLHLLCRWRFQGRFVEVDEQRGQAEDEADSDTEPPDTAQHGGYRRVEERPHPRRHPRVGRVRYPVDSAERGGATRARDTRRTGIRGEDNGRHDGDHHGEVGDDGESCEDAEALDGRDVGHDVGEEGRGGREAGDGDGHDGVRERLRHALVGTPRRVVRLHLQPRVVKDKYVIGADGDEKQRCDEVDEGEEHHLTHEVVEEVGEAEAEHDVGEGAEDQDERTKVHEGKQSNEENGEAEIFQVTN